MKTLQELRALAEAAKTECRMGDVGCPACQAKRELTGDVVLALIGKAEEADAALAVATRLAANVGTLRAALEGVLAVSADRLAFVALRPHGFARAEQIARAALAVVGPRDAAWAGERGT